MTLKRLALVLSLSLLSVELAACATTDKPKTGQSRKGRQKDEARKDWAKANFSLSKNKDIDWKLLRRGRKAMGGPALDSY